MRRWLLAAALGMASWSVFAATVLWDSVVLSSYGSYDGVYYYSFTYPYLGFSGSVSDRAMILWAEGSQYMEISSMWCLAEKGSVASVENIVGEGSYFYAADFAVGGVPSGVQTDYPLVIDDAASIFLKMICRTYVDPNVATVGWVELAYDVDEGLRIEHSAIDLDGGAMIVGGGAIPEPTGGWLVAVGFALIGLRRRYRLAGVG